MGKQRNTATSGSAGRLIVTYGDGIWTDNLSIERYLVEPRAHEVTVCIEVAPRERPGKVRAARAALRQFVARLDRVHTLQIGKARFAEQLRDQVRAAEHANVGVRLLAEGRDVAYPAEVSFGPDEVVVTLG